MKDQFQDIIRRDLEVGDSSWATCHRFGEDGEELELHGVPIDDSDGHQWGLNCHCEPDIEYIEGTPLVMHNAFDGREVVEQANEIINGNSDKE